MTRPVVLAFRLCARLCRLTVRTTVLTAAARLCRGVAVLHYGWAGWWVALADRLEARRLADRVVSRA